MAQSSQVTGTHTHVHAHEGDQHVCARTESTRVSFLRKLHQLLALLSSDT